MGELEDAGAKASVVKEEGLFALLIAAQTVKDAKRWDFRWKEILVAVEDKPKSRCNIQARRHVAYAV